VLLHGLSKPIILVSGIPGSGKTRYILELVKEENQRCVILSRSHSFLTEIEIQLPPDEFIHWEGMKRMCPRQYEDEFFRKLIDFNVSAGWICSLCDWKKCQYKEQFKTNRRIVIAPINYLRTQYIVKFAPELIFIDDATTEGYYLTPLSHIKKYLDELEKAGYIGHRDFEQVLRYPVETVTSIAWWCKWFLKYFNEQTDLQISKEFMKTLFSVRPGELIEWSRVLYAIGFDNEIDTVCIPFALKAFELVEDTQAFFVDAIHDEEILHSYVELYEKYGGKNKLSFISSDIPFEQTHGSVVYRVLSSRYHDHVTYTKESLKHPRMRDDIRWKNTQLLKHFFGDKLSDVRIGLITHKEFIQQDNGDYDASKFLPYGVKAECLHFGDVRGKNKLEDVDILIVVGTYLPSPDGLVKEYLSTYPSRNVTGTLHHVRGRGFVTEDMDLQKWVDRRIKYAEWYQTIHRARPARRVVPIVVHGIVPDLIREKFEVRNIEVLGGDVGVLEYEQTIEEFIVKTVEERKMMPKAELAEMIQNRYPNVGGSQRNIYRRINEVVECHDKIHILAGQHNKHIVVWRCLV